MGAVVYLFVHDKVQTAGGNDLQRSQKSPAMTSFGGNIRLPLL